MEPTTPVVEGQINNGEEVYEPVVVEVEVVEELPVQSIRTVVSPITEPATYVVQEDASILLRGTVPTYVATIVEQQPLGSATRTPTPEASVPSNKNAPGVGNSTHEEVERYSIYIKNLPLSATDSQVEEEFKKFGVVKPGGIQIRSDMGF